jgi:hypothetical protein
VVCRTYDSVVNIPGLDNTVFVKGPLSLDQFMSASARCGRKGNTGTVSLFSSPEGEKTKHRTNEVMRFVTINAHALTKGLPITYYHNEHGMSQRGFEDLMDIVGAATTASPVANAIVQPYLRYPPSPPSEPMPPATGGRLSTATPFAWAPPAHRQPPTSVQQPAALFNQPATQFHQPAAHRQPPTPVHQPRVKLYGGRDPKTHTGWHNLKTGEFRYGV